MVTFQAHFHDGRTAARHDVVVSFGDNALRIASADGRIDDRWCYDDLRAVEPPRVGKPLRLRSTRASGARLIVSGDGLFDHLRIHAPGVLAHGLQRPEVRRWLAAGIAGAAILVIAVWQGLPLLAKTVAPLIPPHWIADWGQAIAQQITADAPACDDADGVAALRRLTERLDVASDMSIPLTVTVVDHKMVNALAAPGGHVVVMRGLIAKAEGPDEVAGVLAHEIGHVAHRHPTQALIRYAGLTLLLDLIAGDSSTVVETVAQAGGLALLLSYNRDMEREADIYARNVLMRAGIGANGLAQFFQRMAEKHGDDDSGIFSYFSTHPPIKERVRALGPGGKPSTPVLDQEAWRALKSICG